MDLNTLPDNILAKIAKYAPLDGMNEKGLAISVNMIQNQGEIQQNEMTQNLTTTTAIRTILNQAADVDEAIAILREVNLHSSMNMMIHFAIADASGKSVVVEYIENVMHVTDTAVVTNSYLTQGDKFGIGTTESQKRYDLLMDILETHKTMDMEDIKAALDRVSKDDFDPSASTE